MFDLLLFIGTADDRCIRPHSFYQAHRVTGKTVTTTCQERIIGCTKVLEIPLLPENNMSASIDCAGILKLRNADIELKKGETDIGRKNTRIRVVFRAAVPQPDGQMLWLQTASIPVECSQRSGQELPQVESFSPASCSVVGGEELLITGANISTQSRVVFMEKGPGGRTLWEMDARAVCVSVFQSSIVVEMPPYNRKTSSPVQVQFYISNGKRRRSLAQSFTFLPAVIHQLVKQEHWEPDHISHNPTGFSPDMAYYDSCDHPVHSDPPSQNASHLHHPPGPLQTPLMFPHNSSIPLHTSSSMPPQASSVPHQTFAILPQTSSVPPEISMMPSQTSSVLPETFTLHPQTSSLPPQTSPVGPQRVESSSLRSSTAFVTTVDPHKKSVLSSSGEALSIKQEPEDQPNLGSLGFHEITLDDGKHTSSHTWRH
uniref:RHD domain-containing protein n=1 Tax=Monopterus albus TaxID=43700 RepID=A0A3Q3JQB5_MONAL